MTAPLDIRVDRKWLYGKEITEYHNKKGKIEPDTYGTNKRIMDFVVKLIVSRQDKNICDKFGLRYNGLSYDELPEIEKKILWLVENHFELVMADKEDKPKQRERILSTVLSWDTKRDYFILDSLAMRYRFGR